MKLVRIPPGEFLMGAPESEASSSEDERPQHRVRITKPFHMGVYEVTQDQYARLVPDHRVGGADRGGLARPPF